MPEVARLGDTMSCGDVIAQGSGNVFAEGMPITRLTSDLTVGHCFLPATILAGPSNQQTVFVNGIEIAIKTDIINNAMHFCIVPPAIHPGPPATVAVAAATVFAYS